MIFLEPTLPGQKTFLLICCCIFYFSLPAQQPGSTKTIRHFGGAVTATNIGLSPIPTFSLGKPAVIFDLNMGKKRLSFEPQLRFALEGKPWSFLFWWRYKLLTGSRFKITLGAHPALNFRTYDVLIDGEPHRVMTARRFLAGEVVPSFAVTKNFSVGMYYLASHGFEKEVTRTTNFLTFNVAFSHIPLPGHFYLKFVPQIYYLRMDQQDGYFVTSTMTLAHNKWPLSISSVANKALRSNISGSKDFVWNVALTYAFGSNYLKN